jgi:hypothetical protein
MSDRYSGITGGLFEAHDTAKERRITYDEALAIQQFCAAHNEQEYRDAIAEIQSSVIHVDFVSRRRLEK